MKIVSTNRNPKNWLLYWDKLYKNSLEEGSFLIDFIHEFCKKEKYKELRTNCRIFTFLMCRYGFIKLPSNTYQYISKELSAVTRERARFIINKGLRILRYRCSKAVYPFWPDLVRLQFPNEKFLADIYGHNES